MKLRQIANLGASPCFATGLIDMKNFCQNKACKMGVWAGKIVITALLVFFVYEIYGPGKDSGNLSDTETNILTAAIITGIILPTIFVFFFKNRIVARYPKFADFWKVGRIVYGIIISLFVIFLVLGLLQVYDKNRTEKAVFRINSVRIILADVMGENLPPKPDQTLNDSTVEGIDTNDNFIRDDVELAIFEKYPVSAKIRAAMLQYAQEIQNELIYVFNEGTWIAVSKDQNNSISCIVELAFNKYNNISDQIDWSNKWQEEIENLTFNTNLRTKKKEEIQKYETSFAVGDGKCDVDLKNLPD